MIHQREAVARALSGVCACVVYGYPLDFMPRELLSWRESDSRCHARADGRELLTELRYSLDIFAQSTARADELLDVADARLSALGFSRQSAVWQLEKQHALVHLSASYRVVADARGQVYGE